MSDLSSQALAAGRVLRDDLASPRLSASIARLYSQHVRLRSGQEGLASFTPTDLVGHLQDAVRLVEASLVSRTQGESSWESGTTTSSGAARVDVPSRAQCCWTAPHDPGGGGVPARGYPARASCLAQRQPARARLPLLRLLVTGNFNALLLLAAQVAADIPVGLDRQADSHGAEPLPVGLVNDVIAGEARISAWGCLRSASMGGRHPCSSRSTKTRRRCPSPP